MDDLGRIVIPKEIRRTMHIHEGDPLEIYTDHEGKIIFKKYSPIGELGTFATQYTATLYEVTGYATFVTDRDNIIAVSGASKKEFLNKRISSDLEKVIEDKIAFISKLGANSKVPITDDGAKCVAGVIFPIIFKGDSIGSIVISSEADSPEMGEVEEKLAQSAAYFLGSQMDQ